MPKREEISKAAPAAWAKFRDESSLSEALVRAAEELRQTLNTKDAATAFLKRHGFLTPSGRIPKKYGG